MDMNQVTLLGRAGQDAELRYTAQGTAIGSFSIATSRNIAKKDQPAQYVPTWHRITVWGKTAELACPAIKKGAKVFVSGEISVREWQDKDGNKKTSFEINARQVEIIQKLETDVPPQTMATQQAIAAMKSLKPSNLGEDDLPF